MKDFDAVVFDMDGVIFDSERAMMGCWMELADKYGIQNLEKPYRACTGTTKERTREIILEAYGEDFPVDAFTREASKLFREKYYDGRLPMKSGVVELLEFLQMQGKRIALASSTREIYVRSELRDAGLLAYFDEIIAGDMVKKSKPEPDIFLVACAKLGVLPGRAFAIEDSYNGIRAASRGGLRPIMVPDLLPANEEMRGLAERVEENLEGVLAYLRE